MKKLGAASLLMAIGTASAATQTVDCGRLLDVKAGVWREKVTVHIENGTVKAIEAMLGKLAGHAMFQGEALERLKMCSDCRVIDLYSAQNETKVTDL